MLALQLRLDFSCCVCAHTVLLTLKCEGTGLVEGTLTGITIDCPTCDAGNLVWFGHEDGRVHQVLRERQYYGIPEPSRN